MHAEKRACPRYPSENEATVTIELTAAAGGGDERIIMCRTADVSLRGVRLMLDCVLLVNTTIRVKVRLGKDAHLFDHVGRVAWCRPEKTDDPAAAGLHNAGIEFTTLPGPMLDEWRNELFARLE